LLHNEELRNGMVETNYRLAMQFYGYGALRKALGAAFSQVSCQTPNAIC
jgi:hypothetical protein